MDEEIAEIVQEHGWFAANVYDHSPPFLYTVGLMQTFTHPELIIFGLESDHSHALFSGIVRDLRTGRSFAEPGIVAIRIGDSEHRIGLRRVHPSQHPLYLGYAMGFVRNMDGVRDLQAVQVFWPEESGKFPFEAGCDLSVYQLQPRLDIGLTKDEIDEFEREWE